MPTLTAEDGLAIWKLIFFSFALIGSSIVCFRHGFTKGSGWIFLAIFCTIRIINASAQIATINSSSSAAVETAAITAVLGLSPLLLATLGLVARVLYDMMKAPWNIVFSLVILKAVQTPAAIALILCIVGGTSADNVTEIAQQPTVQAGIVLFLVVYIAILLLVLTAYLIRRESTKQGDGRLLTAVALAMPLLLIRLVYAMLGTFSRSHSTFSPIDGSIVADLLMATIEEMLIVLIYIWTGLVIKNVPNEISEKGAGQTMLHRAGRGDFSGGKLGILSLAAAVLVLPFQHHKGEKQVDDGVSEDLNLERGI